MRRRPWVFFKNSFLSLGCDGVFCMSPSMDPHLYVRAYGHICICMTYIYIVCLVAMSKFQSSSHRSTLYFSSHEFFVSHMDLRCIGRQPCCDSFGTCIKMCYRKLVMFEKFRPLELCLDNIPCSFKVYFLSFISSHYTLGGILLYQNIITLMLWDRHSLDFSNPSKLSLEKWRN